MKNRIKRLLEKGYFFKRKKLSTYQANIMKYLEKIALFSELTNEELTRIIIYIKVVKYRSGKIIIKEGALAESIYIIMSGSVQVFTKTMNSKRVILARLDEEDYFGEQAYLNNLIRTASVRALTNVKLIKIKYNVLDHIFNRSSNFRHYLEKVSLERSMTNLQALSLNSYIKHILQSSVPYQYEQMGIAGRFKQWLLKKFISVINLFLKHKILYKKTFIRRFKKGEIIFRKGDEFDNVYLILSGSVTLTFAEGSPNHRIIIHENHLFGEIGIINNKPRSATAKANTQVITICMAGDDFLAAIKNNQELRLLTTAFNNAYTLPKHRGVVDQYIGRFRNVDTIYTTYNLSNGKVAECAKVVNQPIFAIKITESDPDKILIFRRGRLIERKIMLKGQLIVGIVVYGEWDEINILSEMLLDEVKLHSISDKVFETTGNLLSFSANSPQFKNDIICNCLKISYHEIRNVIDAGNYEYEQIAKKTGAGTICGSCKNQILDLLGVSIWMCAKITLNKQYNENVCSFLIKPIYGRIYSFNPGQFISIRVMIDSLSFIRSYTVAAASEDTQCYEVFIKKYPDGHFSSWIFQHKDDDSFIWVTKPRGNFLLQESPEKSILCFAEEIGITPFIAFVRDIQMRSSANKVYIFYAVSHSENVIIPQDIKEFLTKTDNVHIEVWDINSLGKVTHVNIEQVINYNSPKYVYICGSNSYEKIILTSLDKLNFPKQNIQVEKFLPAG